MRDGLAGTVHEAEHATTIHHPEDDRSWSVNVGYNRSRDGELTDLFDSHVQRLLAANAGDQPNPMQRITRYTVTIMPAGFPQRYHWEIHVQQVRAGHWQVEWEGELADADRVWMPRPGGADYDRRLFNVPDALRLAHALAPTISGDGRYTAAERLALWKSERGAIPS
jgi:hypothetical protein